MSLARFLASSLAVLLLLSGIAPLSASPALAAPGTYHVAPDGSDDGSGSIDDPWATIQHGMLQLQAGDTLLLRGGTYVERIGTPREYAKGTPDARITVRNYPGERPVIKGLMTLFKGGVHYWTFDGLEFTWDPDTGESNETLVRMVDGIGWEIRNATIHGNHSYAAVRVMAETPGLARDWLITDSCIHSTYPTNGPNNDHNVYVGAGSAGVVAGRGVIERNVIFGAANGSNIKLGAGSAELPGTQNVTIRNNVLADAPHNVLIAWKSHDNIVHHNLMIQQDNGTWSQPWYPNIRGFQLTGTGNRAYVNGGYGGERIITGHTSPQPVGDLGGDILLGESAGVGSSCSSLRTLGQDSGVFGPEVRVDRIAGTSRVATAVQLSRTAFPTGSDAVVLSRSDQYADALAGSPLAGSLGAPVLLTDKDALDPTTAAEISRLQATTAYLLGAEGALSTAVEDALQARGLTTIRVAGQTRFATARAAADLLPATDVVYLVEGANSDPRRGWPDAVALSSLAAMTQRPVLLALRDTLPDDTRQALDDLDPRRVVIVGGTAAVSDAVADAVADPDGDGKVDREVVRVAGADRYETSAAVADLAGQEGADPTRVWLVTGTNWPDALAAGAAASAVGATLLYVHGSDARHGDATLDWIRRRDAVAEVHATIVGGAGAVTYQAEATLTFAYS